MQRRWAWAAALAVLTFALAAGAWAVYQQRVSKPSPPAQTAAPAATSGSDVTLTGTVQAVKVHAVAAPIAGVVDAFFADVGQEVSEGQLLARIKNWELETAAEAASAEVEQAQARSARAEELIVGARLEASRSAADLSRAKTDLERNEKTFERQQLLLKEGATPRLVYEKAQREYEAAKQDLENKQTLAEQAQSRLEELNKDLDASKRVLEEKTAALDQAKAHVSAGDLVSPVDGVVIARHGAPGDDVNPGMRDFFQIAIDLGSLQVTVDPQPPVLAHIRPGQPASVHIAEFPDDLPGSVREIKGTKVVVEFQSPSQLVKPGVSAAVRIRLI